MPRFRSFCCWLLTALGAFSTLQAQVPSFPPANWTYQSNIAGVRLGTYVAPAGDVNGDGFADVAVSAPYYDGQNVDEGLVLLFYGSASGLGAQPGWSVSGTSPSANLSSLEKTGDINGDGFDDILLSDGRLFFG